MNRFLRIVPTITTAFARARLGPLDTSVLNLRVWPHEADASNVHHAIYPLYMELGRWDLAIRNGLAGWLLDKRCAGIMGAETIHFERPLKRLRSFEVKTRVAGWDEKWFYIDHRIEARGRLMTAACARFVFLDRNKKRVQPEEAIRAIGSEVSSPALGDLPALLDAFPADRH